MEDEAKKIEKEIFDIDMIIDELKKRKNEQEKVLNEIKETPDKFKPAQIDNLIIALDELVDRAE